MEMGRDSEEEEGAVSARQAEGRRWEEESTSSPVALYHPGMWQWVAQTAEGDECGGDRDKVDERERQ
jgi:hypothetical protein